MARLTEEQVTERLMLSGFSAGRIALITAWPWNYGGSLRSVGVRWTGDHYEEVDDG